MVIVVVVVIVARTSSSLPYLLLLLLLRLLRLPCPSLLQRASRTTHAHRTLGADSRSAGQFRRGQRRRREGGNSQPISFFG